MVGLTSLYKSKNGFLLPEDEGVLGMLINQDMILKLLTLLLPVMASANNTTYGHQQLENFLLDPTYLNFNHG